MILLCLGFYFLFPACQTFQQIQSEKNTPYELSATTDRSNIDLNTLMQIKGVEKISPVLNISANLSLDDFKLECEIKAVYSSFLNLKFTEGTMYPDSSNMPYLILNKAAAKSFAQDYQTMTVSANDTVMMNMGRADRKAIVSGVFDDGSETPAVYMSYDVAQKEYGQQGQTELLFLLKSKDAAEFVVSALQRQNIYASFDSSITLAWELLQKQCWQTGLLSIGLLACSVVLIQEKRKTEIAMYRSEITMLLLWGMTQDEISRIFPFRILLTEMACILVTLCTAAFLECFTTLGVAVCICFAGIVHRVILTILRQRTELENV